jgi:RNA polymerase sigma-70 factor (ECF subfamily)
MLTASDEDELCHLSDEHLARRADSDLGAFSELYSRYLCRVYGFIRSQTPDAASAEDLTAQTFFRALSGARSFSGEGSYRAWLFRIAHNTLASWRVKHSREPFAVGELPDRTDPSPSPASVVLAGEERHVLWRLVASLAPAQREVLALRYLEDLSTAEIAQATCRSRGAVRILLHRAHNALRGALEVKGLS